MKFKKYGIFILIGLLTLISAFFIYKKLHPKKLPPYLIAGVGRIDGDLIVLNTKYPGRVTFIGVDMGDKVKKGEVIAKLDDKEYLEKLNAINNQIEAKKEELKFLSSKVKNNIQKAFLAVQIKKDQLKAILSQIDELNRLINQDLKDEKRLKKLFSKNFAKKREYELAKLKTQTDKDKLKTLLAKKDALEKELKIAQKNLNIAKASNDNLNALKKEIDALLAKKAELKTIISELIIKSPINGYVDSKVAQVGEVIGAGSAVALLIDPKSFYLKMYVSEINNGKIKIGDKAEIFLDAFVNHPFKAVVSKIAKKAEFTPKEVEVRDDRISRVYEIRLKPLSVSPYFKLGLPAIGVILVGKGNLPKSLNELPPM